MCQLGWNIKLLCNLLKIKKSSKIKGTYNKLCVYFEQQIPRWLYNIIQCVPIYFIPFIQFIKISKLKYDFVFISE